MTFPRVRFQTAAYELTITDTRSRRTRADYLHKHPYGTMNPATSDPCGTKGISMRERLAWKTVFSIAVVVGVGCSGRAATTPGFDQWRYPSCPSTSDTCSFDCMPANLSVSHSACGSYSDIQAGCVPKDLTTVGGACYVRTNDGEVILTQVPPNSFAGLQTCYEAGISGAVVNGGPDCSDGGGP
jgi:hypothetical protein